MPVFLPYQTSFFGNVSAAGCSFGIGSILKPEMVSFANKIIYRIKYLLLVMPILKPEGLALWIAGMLVSQVLLPKRQTPKIVKPVPLREVKSVFLIDDDPAVLKSTRFRLSLQKGLEIFTASSPKEADEMFERIAPRKPDIIVTDYHLGTEKSGLDIIKDIRKRTGSSIPAILLSGDTAIDVAQLESEDITLVFKPSHGNELIDGILRLLSS